ncbi:MAG: SAM-dependent DNA methyltransferase, partial [Planctomycetes bacterium]|nr:SAM-dependent DNA methyltransferase [Planctomycetota bacterium]
SQGSDLFDNGVYPLKTSVGEFRVPAIFAERERMDALANVLDEFVESGVGTDTFLHRLRDTAKLPAKEMSKVEGELARLYKQLKELHDQGLNGVWARIIKNAFAPLFIEPCDYIVGNPPWVNWESLPDEYRGQTKPLWEHYGLFPHGGMDTILGKGKKDISMLMTYVSVDRYLKEGGKLGFVLPQNLFKTIGAGQGFRRFLLPKERPFGPLVVEDMVELNPFEGASNRTAVAVFVKGMPVRYPVSYQLWKKRGAGRGSSIAFDTPYEEVTKEKITFRAWHAEPVDRKDQTSSWITARRRALRALHNVLGQSPYEGHEGSNSGGANAVYWVEIVGQRPGGLSIVTNVTEGAKKKVANTQAAVETELLYPLLRGRDVSRWAAAPSIHILMAQDPDTRRGVAVERMEKRFPKAHSYLTKFEKMLRARPAFRRYYSDSDPFWSMFNISPFTFSPWKVVWREQASTFTAAVVGPHQKRVVVPDHKLMMAAVDSPAEAHYLCAALNSAPSSLLVAAYTIQIQMNTHILENVSVPQFTKSNKTHLRLAELSEGAHNASAKGDAAEIKRIEEEIDRAAARLWGLKENDLAEIKRSLEEA